MESTKLYDKIVYFFSRFCPCFFFYLCSTIPGIWILELKRMDDYQEKDAAVLAARNITQKSQGLDDIQGVLVVLP